MYVDPSGHHWDAVADAIFIGVDIVDLINEPSWSKAGWLLLDVGLAIVPFIPSTSSARHIGKIDNFVDLAQTYDHIDDATDLIKAYGHIENFADAGGVIRIANQMDFIDNGWDLVQGLKRAENGFTISNVSVGKQIHNTFMSPFKINAHNIADGVDDISKTIYELKPYNNRSIRKGIKQLYRYQNAAFEKYGVLYDMVLVLY